MPTLRSQAHLLPAQGSAQPKVVKEPASPTHPTAR